MRQNALRTICEYREKMSGSAWTKEGRELKERLMDQMRTETRDVRSAERGQRRTERRSRLDGVFRYR